LRPIEVVERGGPDDVLTLTFATGPRG
jgi:hypothetical protein